MHYSIEIDHKRKIIHYRHTGEIRKEDIGMAWDDFLKMEEFTSLKYNLLSDYREGKFIGKVGDVHVILGILAKLESILRGKKQAMIISEPMSTALSMLFEGEVNKQIGFKVKVFSTQEKALSWLLD